MRIDGLAASDAVSEGTHSSIEDNFESFERQWAVATRKHAKFTRPFGSSLASRVGFVLSYGVIRSDIAEPAVQNPIRLPSGFVEQGFTEENSLVWTCHLRQYSGLTVGDVQTASSEGRQMLIGFNRQLIQMSSLRVIFLYGPYATDIVLSGLGMYQQLQLHIRKFTYQMFVETSASSPRLYIICPELPVNNLKVPWAVALESMRLSSLRLVLRKPRGFAGEFLKAAVTWLRYYGRRKTKHAEARLGQRRISTSTERLGSRVFPQDKSYQRPSCALRKRSTSAGRSLGERGRKQEWCIL
ncbi:hypothetical protein BR93DRAFT_170019 [Coniochaeta sp. PMI_546]|nr:hypothetical protein BR93DRAFT_170019 [Coniochaeta sp. PMI_546]